MRQESGRSMIEMIGVLAIMTLITIASIKFFPVLFGGQKRGQVVDEVTTIVNGVRSLLGEYDDFSNIDNSTIFGAIGMSNKNPYGGEYSLAVNPSNPRQFVVSISGLSKSECDALKTKAWTDSVGYIESGRKESGATGECTENKKNTVSIIYGE